MWDILTAKGWLAVGVLGNTAPLVLAQVPDLPKDFKEWPPFVVGGLIAIISLFMMYKQGEGYRKTIDKQSDAMIKLATKDDPK